MILIVGLILLGLVLISFEIIVPGGILGFLGGISIIAACALGYQEYGMMAAVWIFAGSLVVALLTLIVELKFLSKTRLGQRMFLHSAGTGHTTEHQGTDELIDKEGTTLTTLAPSGKITVDDKDYEGFSQDGLIKAGEPIRVVGRDNFRIIVKKVKKK